MLDLVGCCKPCTIPETLSIPSTFALTNCYSNVSRLKFYCSNQFRRLRVSRRLAPMSAVFDPICLVIYCFSQSECPCNNNLGCMPTSAEHPSIERASQIHNLQRAEPSSKDIPQSPSTALRSTAISPKQLIAPTTRNVIVTNREK